MKVLSLILVSIFVFSCNREHIGEGKSNNYSFNIDDENRRFTVYSPSNFDANKEYPVMFALHGRYGNPRNMAKMTNFNPLADEQEFLVVYPRGFRRSWNDGRGEGPAAENDIDDVKFMKGIIGFLKANYPIDENKLFVSGMSNGGFMTMRLACEMSKTFKAFISVTGSLAKEFDCNPVNPVNLMLIAGTDDDLVPYNGGEVASSETFSIGFKDLLNFWGSINNCSSFNEEKLPQNHDDGTSVIKFTYKGCDNDVQNILYKINNGGHTWSSGNNFFGEGTTGVNSKELNASEEIMSFCLSL